ncbi:MAG: hypothetical protein EZS28_038690 [Streblomastix strix]|uniref:Uncharacterized protein n=1 Tax=Streblomastix strix TaxID=222440 RepID=A0A5J4U678_9EUKA|nr:MAG: hypothetical protein EZS28_038690 [Streblomastix strix]
MGLQQGADKASVVLVGESLNLCQSLCSAYSTISDDVFKIKGFVEKIIDLMQFKVSEDEAQKKDLEDLLKVNSMKCVSQFQFYGGPDKQQKLVKEMKYIKSLVISIGCAGGTEHEKNYQTLHALYAFISLVDSIYGKISWCLPNIHLLKDLREELQENGGNEEIDANCFSCLGQSHYEIGGVAIRLKNYELWKNNQ